MRITVDPSTKQSKSLKYLLIILVSLHHTLKMVCEKCESKLTKVVTPDPWKTTNAPAGGRKINENKALSTAKDRFNPISKSHAPCRICRQKVHQVGSHYCQACAYKKAICAMCGKKILNTKNYKQSST